MSGYVRSRKFLCCLPVRLGVFILSLLAMVGGSFVAAIGWIQVSQMSSHPREKSDEIALYIQSAMFSILGLLAVLGFIGTLIKSRGMVSSFAIGLAIHLGFSVASGIFAMYALFSANSKEAIEKCVNGSEDEAVITTCKGGLAIVKGVMVAVYIITWFVQLYFYFVVERYVDQLDDEKMAENTVVIPRSMVQDIGGPQGTTYTGLAPPYPFTSPRAAYGVAQGQDASNRV